MFTQKQCSQLREKLYELIIEPETAPQKLLKDWLSHCRFCMDCVDFFIQQSQEQKMVHSLLLQLETPHREKILKQSVSSSRTRFKTRVKYWPYFSIAALLGLLSILQWKGEMYFVPYKNLESVTIPRDSNKSASQELELLAVSRNAQFKLLLENLFQTIQSKQDTEQGILLSSQNTNQWEQEGREMMEILWKKQIFEKINAEQIPSLTEPLFWHLQKTRHEFRSILDLTPQYEKELQKNSLPFLSRKINLYCRLALMNPDVQILLPELEKKGYPPSEIQKLFEFPIQELAQTPQYKNQWIHFFQKSSRHLQNIWVYRNRLLTEIGVDSIEKLGGKLELLTLVDQLESLINPQ